jgi:osmotically-inducible protein OsmY
MVLKPYLGVSQLLAAARLMGLLLVVGLPAACVNKVPSGYALYKPRPDATVRANIEALWQKSDPDLTDQLNLQISDGLVIVAGAVDNEQARITALRDVWDAEGVREVVNEIRIANSSNNKLLSKDNAVAVKLRTRLTFDPSITSVDYSIEVSGSTAYLMGRAQSQEELDRVISYAGTMPSIEKVVSYVKIRG